MGRTQDKSVERLTVDRVGHDVGAYGEVGRCTLTDGERDHLRRTEVVGLPRGLVDREVGGLGQLLVVEAGTFERHDARRSGEIIPGTLTRPALVEPSAFLGEALEGLHDEDAALVEHTHAPLERQVEGVRGHLRVLAAVDLVRDGLVLGRTAENQDPHREEEAIANQETHALFSSRSLKKDNPIPRSCGATNEYRYPQRSIGARVVQVEIVDLSREAMDCLSRSVDNFVVFL